MPALTRWLIRISFVYLGIGLAAGILLAVQPLSPSLSWTGSLFPEYLHLLVIGWLTLLIFGVANWMFPRFSAERPHGNPLLNWSGFALLNAGLLMRLFGEPLYDLTQAPFWSWFLVVSALLLWLGGLAFIFNLWRRVKVK